MKMTNKPIVHTVTYNLHTYEEVLDKSKLVQEAGGVIVSVKTTPNAFDDCKKVSNRGPYTLVTRVPVSVAIRYC